VTVIDGATNGVIATVAVGSNPAALCYNLTNNKVYCVNNGSADVTVIDGATDDVVATIGVGVLPMGFAWNPVQNRVYVANRGRSSISVLRDSMPPVGVEVLEPRATSSKPFPTIVRGVLVLGAVGSRQNTAYRAELMNACGRMVLDLHAGANDVRALPPGVYFIWEALGVRGEGPGKTRKVVVTE
jgi:YVTN family beta-propeller protein